MSDNKMTKSGRFIEERKESWLKAKDIINKTGASKINKLTDEEFVELPDLYRRITTDAETAYALELSPDIIDYLENLVVGLHNLLFTVKRSYIDDLKKLIFEDFAFSFKRNIIPLTISFILFFGSIIISTVVVYKDPSLFKAIAGEEAEQQMLNSFSDAAYNSRSLSDNIYMTGFYIRNNVSIALMSFAVGIIVCIGTLYLLLYNGIMIGASQGFIIGSGYGKNFFDFVTAHSSFELLGICIAAGAGLALGMSILFPGREKRIKSLAYKAREIVPIIITAAFLIGSAAFIEGFLSPTKIPYIIKLIVCLATLSFVIFFSFRVIFFENIKKIKYVLSRRHKRWKRSIK